MARQFAFPQGKSPGHPARVAVAAGIVALAVMVKACGDSKPRVADIPDQASSSAIADAPSVAMPEGTTATPQPVATAPVTFADGETAFHDRRYQEAATAFTSYTEQQPGNVWGHYMLGLSEWKAGKPERAVPAFERVLETDSTHRKTLLNLARVLLETGRSQDGLARAERAVQVDSGSAEAWRLVGRALSDLGRTDEAIHAYHRALAVDETDGWSMNNLGVIHLRAGRYAEALPPLARATELAPERAAFQNNLGLVLERLGHPVAAATAYRAAIAADTTHDKASASLARVVDRPEASGLVPVNLAELARGFAAEIGRWKEELAVAAKP